MEIIRTYVPKSLANYNHLVYCPATQQAAAIDPFDAQHLKQVADRNNLTITQIWLTHEHGDHIRGLASLKEMTDASSYAPMTCSGLFEADYWLEDAQTLTLGDGQLSHYLTPGHTPGHGVFHFQGNAEHQSFLVCADTLFNAGVGNTRSGNVETLYQTVLRLKALVSPETQLFTGHDYICTNLKFVLTHFPDCDAARALLEQVSAQTPDTRSIMHLVDELHYNPFLNPGAPWVTANPDFAPLSEKERFIELRSRRDQW